ncbi:30S ribosomal protein S13 [Candidatus Berkelbacteria bacterium CG_4_10_14_0_8_um_filter_35_9_33_8]|uniref:Small ribosomal subunit protein uS13 n=1 Tax=Candidatus Berkelbacteria bacterium CG_4_10_14_0_2_um_filter_35_9_33_12 TaxID=1974499 RepID=A0A2M7W5G3_9BACT|nr:MAG: 30S ribosomal protein S13 [Candidatus Berkelbacteria bacterium CG23_combo_of_CG06-09_8_20_14_all_33_15]PIS08109.1 MAG: 30S ribosomal protein S13 [Candidatus Berkelbacteria bacterium CG10_big_fil_rev_8_21_14_0_10_33_10]PIZ27976.1 MAG: 30S ribosomal protein S13 [Candidatus Berkelbacteria bacterium CG_4_10_14_0_8_um_filter_35_9_33_8]PJA20774.1 MAG: 30S ribosomal protein S13 [Candidatus Berkelbacteria bacterium CG_4_10_14_0_2_um_filter_35_9_33_12]
MAVRISGVILDLNKRVEAALPKIFGVGYKNVKTILSSAKINPDTRVKNLTDEEIDKIKLIINDNYRVENDLKIDISQNIRLLKDIQSYRGSRHIKGLPTRGQRTKTNARTKRGKKVTVGSGRKKASEKT